MPSRRRPRAVIAAGCWIAGAFLAHCGPASERTTLRSPAGLEVPARRLGPAGGRRALLLHGVSASKETMMALAEALAAAGYECTLVDFRGHGASTGVFDGGLVDTIRAATAGDSSRFAVVVGHSMGAGAAREA